MPKTDSSILPEKYEAFKANGPFTSEKLEELAVWPADGINFHQFVLECGPKFSPEELAKVFQSSNSVLRSRLGKKRFTLTKQTLPHYTEQQLQIWADYLSKNELRNLIELKQHKDSDLVFKILRALQEHLLEPC